MSSIAGYVRLDGGQPDPDLVATMAGRMIGRAAGPATLWASGPAAFARVEGTGPRAPDIAQALPQIGQRVVLADARVDNRDALIADLNERVQGGDEALVAHALARWDGEGLARLRGDFAVAEWDIAERRLLLARDPFGIRPLYYAHVPGVFVAFASEIKGLKGLDGVSYDLDEYQLAAHVGGILESSDRTVYEGVRRVPRGDWLLWTPSAHSHRSYHELSPRQGMEGWSTEDYVEGFRERFDHAVRVRSISDGPVGAHLSGGLDSSSIAVVARDVLRADGETLHTFTLTFAEGAAWDESSYANAVIRQGGFTPHYVRGDETGPLENLGDVYQILDDTVVEGNQHTLWEMFARAETAGVHVLLDGLDGDTTVGYGYGLLRELARAGNWEQFATEARAITARFGSPQHYQPFEAAGRSLDTLFASYGYPALRSLARRRRLVRTGREVLSVSRHLGASPKTLVRSLAREAILGQRHKQALLNDAEEVEGFLDPDFAARTGLGERLREASGRFAPGSEREGQRLLFSTDRHELGLSGLNQIGARFGIEPRHPFMDLDLVEYCLALPSSLSLNKGWPRFVLREALRGRLPDLIADRIGKTDMSGNSGSTLFHKDGDRLEAMLGDGSQLAGIVRKGAVDSLKARARRDDPGTHSDARVALIRLAALSALLKSHGSA